MNCDLIASLKLYSLNYILYTVGKCKAIPVQVYLDPEGSRWLRIPDFKTTGEGGKVVSLTHRPPLPPENIAGTHFYYRLSRPQGHSAGGRIISMINSNNITGIEHATFQHVVHCFRPSRHRFFLVSLCLKANAEMVPKIPSCHYMHLM